MKDIGSVGLQFVVQYAILDFVLNLGLLLAAVKARKNIFFFGAARAAGYRPRTTLTFIFLSYTKGAAAAPLRMSLIQIARKSNFVNSCP